MTATSPSAQREHRIPPPTGEREPLKVNVYEQMQHANTQLVPLFPYYGPGAIVYSGALFRGGPGYDVGHFFHYNTVDEISFIWGAHGGLLETGRLMAQPNLHGVNSFLRNPEDPDSFLLVTVVQRQSDTEPQTEKLLWKCRKCHGHLFEAEFTDRPTDEHTERFPEFPTLNQSVEPVARFNSDQSLRTCKACGYVNPEFPMDLWGWAKWSMHQRTVNDARAALLAKAAETFAGTTLD